MAKEQAEGAVRRLSDMTDEEIRESGGQSVRGSVWSFGELVYEPGMSREEERIRTRDLLWRHSSEASLEERTAEFVRRGFMTKEEADEHKARRRALAAQDRLYVEKANVAREARLRVAGASLGKGSNK